MPGFDKHRVDKKLVLAVTAPGLGARLLGLDIERPDILTSFFRYCLVALLATAVDFIVLIFLTEILQFWYLFSAFAGSVAGGGVGFVLARNWAFLKQDRKLSFQALKYGIVLAASTILNIVGLYLIVEFAGYQYIISRIIAAIIIGVGFNFSMNRYFVFN